MANEDKFNILFTVAKHYLNDAIDFGARYDLTWEHGRGKSGRAKAVVDLLMSCECILKAHVLLSDKTADPVQAYKQLRSCSHDIARLADAAKYLNDRQYYDTLKSELKDISVFLRYSLDFYETFFPSADDFNAVYQTTLGNAAWLKNVRQTSQTLIDKLAPEFDWVYEGEELSVMLKHEKEMKAFIDACMR